MKNIKILLFVSVIFSLLFSCTKDEKNSSNPGKGSKKSSQLFLGDLPQFPCNDEPAEFCLIAGQTEASGKLSIVNSQDTLYVQYTVNSPLLLESIHLWIGSDLGDVPVNNKGIPVPGQFPYKVEGINNDTITILIPLSEVPDECFYVLAHAALSNGQTAWAGDCDLEEAMTFSEYFNIPRWGFIARYCPVECDQLVVLKIHYNDAAGVLRHGLIAGAQHYYSSDWCQFLGVNPLQSATYDVVSTSNVKVGSATLTVYSDHLSVSITLIQPGAVVTRSYLFIGDAEQLATYGDCPEYTHFPLPSALADQDSFDVPL